MLGSSLVARSRGSVVTVALAGAALVLPVTLAGIALAPAASAVSPEPTTTTLTVTPTRPDRIVGTWLDFHATVTTAAPNATDFTGTLNITEGTATIATTPVNVTAGATTIDVPLATSVKVNVAGVHTYVARFTPGTSDYEASSSASVPITIVRIPTKVALTTVPAAAVDAGKVLTLRAAVSPAAGGTIRFTDGARVLRSVGIVKGVATLRLIPARGTHNFRAWFVPSKPGTYAASASPVVKATSGAARALPLGAGSFGPLVVLAQSRLVWNGIPTRITGTYDAATIAGIKRFQGKFNLRATGVADARTMNLMAKLAVRVLPRSCTSVHMSICVDKTRKIAQLVIDGRVVISLDARFGSTRSPALETREGVFRVQRKDATHVSSEYHTPMPWAMFFSGGQAVHYSKYFAAVGYNGASHGCVNTRDWNGVKKMFSLVKIGTRVVIYRS